jgi:hypothetical protein
MPVADTLNAAVKPEPNMNTTREASPSLVPENSCATRVATGTGHVGSAFWTHFTSELLASCYRRELNNIDRGRFRFPFSIKRVIKKKICDLAASFGFYRSTNVDHDVLRIDGLDRAYELLEDQLSRDLFVRLLAYRVLGRERVRLPLKIRQNIGV